MDIKEEVRKGSGREGKGKDDDGGKRRVRGNERRGKSENERLRGKGWREVEEGGKKEKVFYFERSSRRIMRMRRRRRRRREEEGIIKYE